MSNRAWVGKTLLEGGRKVHGEAKIKVSCTHLREVACAYSQTLFKKLMVG